LKINNKNPVTQLLNI